MRNAYYVLLLPTILALNGCNNQQDVIEYVEQVQKSSVGKVEPLPPVKEYQSKDYTAQNLRSPFSRSKTVVVQNTKVINPSGIVQAQRPDINRRREFLENYPLSSFNMVGALSKGNYFWGLLEDNSGKVYAVQVGDYIGQNSGRITKIDNNEIDIDETVPNGKGGWMHSTTTLTLKEPSQ